MSDTRPFTQFVKEHRSLRVALGRMTNPVYDHVRKLSSTEQVDSFVANELAELLKRRPDLPEIGGMRAGRIEGTEFARTSDGRRVGVARHWIAVEVRGDPTLIGSWPEESNDLPAVDDPSWAPSGLTVDNRETVWQHLPITDDGPSDSWALYTYFDLTLEEEQAITDKTIDLNPLIEERLSRVEPILARIREQTMAYFETEYPTGLGAYVSERRRMLANREGVTASLRFPKTWEMPPPELEPERSPTSSTSDDDAAELTVPHTPRLSAVSFASLQRTIRVWADAIERYPRAFRPLLEDQVSDLLAATLNATMPGAQREVYTPSGKSDIFVRADVVSEGSGPARIFIAETKWVNGEAQVEEALDPQLFGYLTASDTAAVLLLLLRQREREKAVARYSAVLRDIAGFEFAEASSVEGWPLYVYTHEGRTVRICVAWVHTPDRGPKPASQQETTT